MRKSALPFYPLPDLGPGRRGRVFRRLLEQAMDLLRRGHIPSVAEVARSARVSRATAYRYFPTRSKLVSAVIAEALAPVRRAVPQQGDPKQRLLWYLWDSWISEILADFWAVAKVGVSGTLGLMEW